MSQACLSDSVMWRKKRTSRREIRKKSICIIFWSTLYRLVIFSRIPCVIQIYMPVLFCFKIKHSPRSWRAHQVKVLVIIENSKQSATMRRKWPQVFRVTLFSPNHMSNQTKEISSNAFAFFRKWLSLSQAFVLPLSIMISCYYMIFSCHFCVLAEVEGRNRNRIRGRPGQQMDSRKASQLLKLPPSGASKAMMTHKYPWELV